MKKPIMKSVTVALMAFLSSSAFAQEVGLNGGIQVQVNTKLPEFTDVQSLYVGSHNGGAIAAGNLSLVYGILNFTWNSTSNADEQSQ